MSTQYINQRNIAKGVKVPGGATLNANLSILLEEDSLQQ